MTVFGTMMINMLWMQGVGAGRNVRDARLDMLVSLVEWAHRASFDQIDIALMRRKLAISIASLVLMSRATARAIDRCGRTINIPLIVASSGSDCAVYGATKGAGNASRAAWPMSLVRKE